VPRLKTARSPKSSSAGVPSGPRLISAANGSAPKSGSSGLAGCIKTMTFDRRSHTHLGYGKVNGSHPSPPLQVVNGIGMNRHIHGENGRRSGLPKTDATPTEYGLCLWTRRLNTARRGGGSIAGRPASPLDADMAAIAATAGTTALTGTGSVWLRQLASRTSDPTHHMLPRRNCVGSERTG